MNRRAMLIPALSLVIAACGTSGVDLTEPVRFLGRENNVRIDAEMRTDTVGQGSSVPVTYQITNLRPTPIAVADMIVDTTFDEDSRTITMNIGSEVPGNELLPRLIVVAPGETKTFTAAARMNFFIANQGLFTPWPETIRLKLNYLEEVKPFQELVGIPENAVRNPQLADELFSAWIEHNETVVTNSLPVQWGGRSRQIPR